MRPKLAGLRKNSSTRSSRSGSLLPKKARSARYRRIFTDSEMRGGIGSIVNRHAKPRAQFLVCIDDALTASVRQYGGIRRDCPAKRVGMVVQHSIQSRGCIHVPEDRDLSGAYGGYPGFQVFIEYSNAARLYKDISTRRLLQAVV